MIPTARLEDAMEGNFYTKGGQALTGITAGESAQLWSTLQEEYGVSSLQLCEAASYSFAMVIRYALGLSAAGGRVGAFVNDTRAGWVTLATVRHLANGGSAPHVVFLMDPNEHGPEIEQLIQPLERIGVPMDHWSCFSTPEAIGEFLGSCHNLLFGIFRWPHQRDEVTSEYVKVLNEVQTPIHAVDAPFGVDPDLGVPCDEPLYASSTLSLGLPFRGLAKGNEYVGRHYVCDISMPPLLYASSQGDDFPPLFAEQPVTQIFTEPPTTKRSGGPTL